MKKISTLSYCLFFTLLLNAQTQVGPVIPGQLSADQFGYNVAVSADGTRFVGSAPFNDANGIDAGQVIIYTFDGTNWNPLGNPINGQSAGDEAGTGLSMSDAGDRVAIGAPGHDIGGMNDAGQVRVFEYNGTNWIQLGSDIDGSVAGDLFGEAVSISPDGNRLAVGATKNDDAANDAGQVKVYEYNGSNWTQLGADINGTSTGINLGLDVALSMNGDRLVTSSTGGLNDAGAVEIYDLVAGDWSLAATFTGDANGDKLGTAVAIADDGNTVAAGAFLHNNINGNDAGQVQIYRFSAGSWSELPAIEGVRSNDFLGYDVALSADGNGIAIGIPQQAFVGAGRVMFCTYDGTRWVDDNDAITGNRDGVWAGFSVAISDDGGRLVFGAPLADFSAANAGLITVLDLIVPLPVEWISFNGKLTEGGNLLTWATAAEVNNLGFEIEYSVDARNWMTLDFIDAEGTDDQGASYTYLHENPFSANSYYRLRQVDHDGAFEYSTLIQIEDQSNQHTLIAAPNPTEGIVSIYGDISEKAIVRVVNAQGRVVLIPAKSNQPRMDLSEFVNGLYYVQVIRGAEVDVFPIVLEK